MSQARGQLAAHRERIAVDRGDHTGASKPSMRSAIAWPRRAQSRAARASAVAACGRCRRRRRRPSRRPGDDHRAQLRRGRDLVEAAVEIVEHLGREGVERSGAIERDDRRRRRSAFQIDGHGPPGSRLRRRRIAGRNRPRWYLPRMNGTLAARHGAAVMVPRLLVMSLIRGARGAPPRPLRAPALEDRGRPRRAYAPVVKLKEQAQSCASESRTSPSTCSC